MDPYGVLGIAPGASETEVKAAYRAMARRHHPDMHSGASEAVRQNAEHKFRAISDAYQALTDGAPAIAVPPAPPLTAAA